MIGVGVGLLLNHHASASTSTGYGPRVAGSRLRLCASALPLPSNGATSTAAINFRMTNLRRGLLPVGPVLVRMRRAVAGQPGQAFGVPGPHHAGMFRFMRG